MLRFVCLLLLLITPTGCGQVVVEVRDPQGNPIPEAGVVLIPLDDEESDGKRVNGPTDDNGIYAPVDGPGVGDRYRICIYPPEGYLRPENREVTFTRDPEVMILPECGCVTVRVVDAESEQEVKNAVLFCLESGSPEAPTSYPSHRRALRYQQGGITHRLSRWNIDRFAGFRAEAPGYEPSFTMRSAPAGENVPSSCTRCCVGKERECNPTP